MSDIIERLHGPDGIEAAREITRLREENAQLRVALIPFAARLDELEKSPLTKYACATQVEIEHLRAARAAIREGGKNGKI